MIKKWKKIKTEETYHCGKWYRIDKDKVITPGGKEGTYYVMRKTPSVIIIPVDKQGNIYLTNQHRYPTNIFSLELPSGHTEGMKNLLSCAKKELKEEIGHISGKWTSLGLFYPSNGHNETKIFVFLAENIKLTKNYKKDPLDKNLHETKIFSYTKIKEMIGDGNITDGVSLSALAIAEAKGVFNKLK